jgi:hypothetical protein
MTSPRDDFIISMRVPTSAAPDSLAADATPAPAPPGAGVPLCEWLWCDKPATHGDLCEPHFEQTQDLRDEYDMLRREFEEGW